MATITKERPETRERVVRHPEPEASGGVPVDSGFSSSGADWIKPAR